MSLQTISCLLRLRRLLRPRPLTSLLPPRLQRINPKLPRRRGKTTGGGGIVVSVVERGRGLGAGRGPVTSRRGDRGMETETGRGMAGTDTDGGRDIAIEMATITIAIRRRGTSRGPVDTTMVDTTEIDTRVAPGARAHCDG